MTSSTWENEIESLLSMLEKFTVLFAIVLFMIATILTIFSLHQTKKGKTGKKMGNINPGNKYREYTAVTSSEIRRVTLVDYIKGYSNSPSHLVIGIFCLEIYDIYTDFAYLFELLNNYQDTTLFGIFLASMFVSLVLNGIIIFYFFQSELSYAVGLDVWFYEHSNRIIGLICVFVFTDVTMITSVFTSQIFGYSLFFAPMSMKGIQMIQMSSFLYIFVAHAPQLAVQVYTFEYYSNEINITTIASILVSCIDIFFVAVKGCIWAIVYKQKLNQHQATLEHKLITINENDSDDENL